MKKHIIFALIVVVAIIISGFAFEKNTGFFRTFCNKGSFKEVSNAKETEERKEKWNKKYPKLCYGFQVLEKGEVASLNDLQFRINSAYITRKRPDMDNLKYSSLVEFDENDLLKNHPQMLVINITIKSSKSNFGLTSPFIVGLPQGTEFIGSTYYNGKSAEKLSGHDVFADDLKKNEEITTDIAYVIFDKKYKENTDLFFGVSSYWPYSGASADECKLIHFVPEIR